MNTTEKLLESKPKNAHEEENLQRVQKLLKDAKQEQNSQLAKEDLKQILDWYRSGFKRN